MSEFVQYRDGYAVASRTYDNTRAPSDALIDRLAVRVPLGPGCHILDFGCGTANYLRRIADRFGCSCHGVEPSDGMRAVAFGKGADLDIRKGDHLALPFRSAMFDFCYMTDVIHHVPDLDAMFGHLAEVLKPGAPLVVVTDSHRQIEARFYNRYFPSLAAREKARYPEIDEIVRRAAAGGFDFVAEEMFASAPERTVTADFIRHVAEKNYSMFRQLPDAEFADGLRALSAELGRCFPNDAGDSPLVWLLRRPATRWKGSPPVPGFS